jgi:hypothetical protein
LEAARAEPFDLVGRPALLRPEGLEDEPLLFEQARDHAERLQVGKLAVVYDLLDAAGAVEGAQHARLIRLDLGLGRGARARYVDVLSVTEPLSYLRALVRAFGGFHQQRLGGGVDGARALHR